jgi:hypothetical protein
LIQLASGSIGGTRSVLTISGGKVTVNVSERPIFVLADNTAPDPVMTSKLVLTPSMVTNESGSGNATQMVDEQTLAGDPREPHGGGNPVTMWLPTTSPASAYINLGQMRNIDRIYIYDANAISDLTVAIGSPTTGWTTIFTDPLSNYNGWNEHVVNINTQYIRFTRVGPVSNFNEVVLYGK